MDLYNHHYFSKLEQAEQGEVIRNSRLLLKIEKSIPAGRLFDVGVGTGLFLKLAKYRGWDVSGMDISAYAVKKVKQELNVPVYQGELLDLPLRANYYEAVNMRHSIEHIPDDIAVLGKVLKILKPGGVLCIATPNSYGLHAWVYGKQWPHWDLKHHVNFYSKNSLQRLVTNAGFEIIEASTEELTIYNIINALTAKLGFDVQVNYTNKWSLLVDRILAYLGLGEGLVLLARKPK